MIVELNEKEVRVLRDVLNEASKKPTKVTMYFYYNEDLNDLIVNDPLFNGCENDEADFDPSKYRSYLEGPIIYGVPIENAKAWVDKAMENNEELFVKLQGITTYVGDEKVCIYDHERMTQPHWEKIETPEKQPAQPRFVMVAISEKGLKYETALKIAKKLEAIGEGQAEYWVDDKCYVEAVPLKGLKATLASFFKENPTLKKRTKIYSDYNCNHDITSKYI